MVTLRGGLKKTAAAFKSPEVASTKYVGLSKAMCTKGLERAQYMFSPSHLLMWW